MLKFSCPLAIVAPMFGPFHHRFAQFIHHRPRHQARYCTAVFMVACVGCSQTKPLKPELTLQVQAASQPGTYVASGKTTLPNQSRITVQAVRQLTPVGKSPLTNQKPLYAILDRQQVDVMDGKWQTNLNLLRSAGGGTRELWQVNSTPLELPLQPQTDVAFLAVSDELALPLDIQTNKDSNQPLENSALQFSRNGNAYLQAKQSLLITPPVVKTLSLVNQKSNLVKLEPATTVKALPDQKRQTDAPLAPVEYLQ